MSERESDALGWVLEQRMQRQEISSHETYAIGARPERPLQAAGGITLKSSDNVLGQRELEFDVRPVILGQVEVCVRLTTQAPDAARPHSKRAFLHASPAAMRELAWQLLDTADRAEQIKPRPKPVR
ncbi:hypothetical protein [Phenylobacterium sp.]|uniref:hypothetical protein n=1 Tax=Phenylobacterium sp. TaxID=1871053 RepID=UPI002FC913A7